MQNAPTVRSGSADPWPKYHQIYLVLLQQIQEGHFPAGVPLPNEMQLAQQFAVSRITVRKAMERLDREGHIERHRGRGTFVRMAARTSPVQASLSGVIENLIAMGLETDVRVLSLDYVAASPEVAGALDLEVGATVQKAVRLRSIGGRTFSYLVSYVPESLGRTYDEKDLLKHPLLMLLERGGAHVDRAEQVISATLATPEIAAHLQTDPGAALLSIRRVVFDQGGRPIEYITGLYRPDTYEHQMTFERRSGSTGPIWKLNRGD